MNLLSLNGYEAENRFIVIQHVELNNIILLLEKRYHNIQKGLVLVVQSLFLMIGSKSTVLVDVVVDIMVGDGLKIIKN